MFCGIRMSKSVQKRHARTPNFHCSGSPETCKTETPNVPRAAGFHGS